jgi:hypothetical protein
MASGKRRSSIGRDVNLKPIGRQSAFTEEVPFSNLFIYLLGSATLDTR